MADRSQPTKWARELAKEIQDRSTLMEHMRTRGIAESSINSEMRKLANHGLIGTGDGKGQKESKFKPCPKPKAKQ